VFEVVLSLYSAWIYGYRAESGSAGVQVSFAAVLALFVFAPAPE